MLLPSGQFKLRLIRLSCWIIVLSIVCPDETHGNDAIELSSSTADVPNQTEAEEEFAHLFNRAAASKRVHLVSEHVRNGHRLIVEEFLDLETWNQFLQFKWNEDTRLEEDVTKRKPGESQALSTRKISVIVLNDGTRKVMVQFEPYTCDISVKNSNKSMEGDISPFDEHDWWALVADNMSLKSDDPSIKPRRRHGSTIQSLMSTSLNSPYLARVPTNSHSDAWVFGIAGLWLKAQYPRGGSESGDSKPAQQFSSLHGNVVKVKDSEAWRLNLQDANATIIYYFNDYEPMKTAYKPLSNAEYDRLNLIELRYSITTHLIDLINVISVDFDFSNQLMRDLFKLPVGYKCPTNPILKMTPGFYFVDISSTSQATSLEIETVATRYGRKLDDDMYSATDVKGLSIATCRHPMNSLASLSMFHILEDHLKIIRDYHSKIMYQIHANGSEKNHCQISGLHIYDLYHRQATNPIEVSYSNGIRMNLNEVFLDYIMNSKGKIENEQVFLNRVERASEDREELIFETQVPDSYTELLQVLDRRTGKPIARRISLVRVYELPLVSASVKSETNKYKLRRSRAAVLVRIILIVLDHMRLKKLAEVRFNLIRSVPLISHKRRAQLFDLSQCYSGKNEQQDSMELIVSYPIEPELVRYVQGRSHELVDEFYLSSMNWSGLESKPNGTNSMELDKWRLGVSLNYLRVPKVELLSSSGGGGNFKLKLLVLDKASNLHLFDQMLESTFISNTMEETLLVSNIEECAQFCQLQKCRLFAYDQSSLECKLSPISVEDLLEEDDEVVGGDPVTIVRKANSKVYYAAGRQDQIDSQAPVEEASLAELYSYLEHSAGELATEKLSLPGEDDENEEEEKEETFVLRPKRAKRGAIRESPDRWPLFSFQFTDRSDLKQAYAPPKRRILVPDEIKAIRVPLTMDISQEFQKIKVASAFKAYEDGKTYQINILDNSKSTIQTNPYERTFVDRNNSILYSLKRLYQIELPICALMCYNIDEWDARLKAEQICQSFSYCRSGKQCTLMVKTDPEFTGILSGQEGEQVLDINSTDQLIADGSDCMVSKRNYLAKFEGPIRLPSGYKSTTSFVKLSSDSFEYEWLTVMNVESSEIYIDSQDNCAKECDERNRVGKMCIALDFCINKTPPGFKINQKKTRYQAICDLLLISGDNLDSSASSRSMIVRRIRNQLIQQPLSTENYAIQNNKTRADGFETNCNRYLVSHLSEFNHLKLRKVSQKLAGHLETTKFTINNVDCALECSTRRDKCLAFEYCSKFDYATKALQMNCTLFGGLERGLVPHSNWLNEDPKSLDLEQITSTYSRDCHIYLKNEFKSLNDLLSHTELNTNLIAPEHHELLYYCTILLFIASVIMLYLYLRSTNRLVSCKIR